jgi:hypothetical protein
MTNGVTSIGESAFFNCSSLTEITIPNSVTSISNYAFCGCSALTEVTIPNSVTSIDFGVFFGCNSLTDITIPNSVTSIGGDAFSGCSSLKSVTIPDSVTSIGSTAFQSCSSLTSVTIPDSVTSIDISAFDYCYSLISITIPESVTHISSSAFSCCYKLVEVYNLSKLEITKGSEDNGKVAYYALNVYTSKDGTSKLKTTDDLIFYEDGDTVYLMGYTGSSTTLILPDKYNDKNYEIYDYAFYNCSNLMSVTIGSGVTSIGKFAFLNCSSLTSVTFENTSGWWCTYDPSATSGTNISSIDLNDTPTAAGFLRNTYCSYWWHRS